jgi:hypothetical protein
MPFRAGDLGEQFAHHAVAHGVDRLADRGQPGDGLLRVRRVVESDDRNVVGNAPAEPVQGMPLAVNVVVPVPVAFAVTVTVCGMA